MRTVTFYFTAAADGRKWDVDRDCTLVAAQSYQNNGFVSRDPKTTSGNVQTPVDNRTDFDFICVTNTPIPAKIPLLGGRSIYLSSNAAGIITLYLDEVEAMPTE
jgi:hypothetical protein